MRFIRKLKNISLRKYSIALSLLYLIIGLITLPRYGINWDTINHLPRGQAYLHFFLTGEKNFNSLPEYKPYYQDPTKLIFSPDVPKEDVVSTSYYQAQGLDYEYFIKKDGGGHPPLSDILSSLFNRIFFQKLKLFNDIDAYRIYGVLCASILVGLIFYWASTLYGKFAGMISALTLSTYPLFFSESHFNNEKDIPLSLFWSFVLFLVWKGIKEKNKKWILFSGVFFGLALGTKFNILFIPLVIIPWLVSYLFSNRSKVKSFVSIIPTAIAAIVIGMTIAVTTWPYLWSDIITKLSGVFGFYKEIGTEAVQGFNWYAAKWIIYSTHPLILLFLLIGIIYAASKLKKEKNKASLIFLLWFFVPIIRVTLPGTSIYGGVRQIMEYIPALAILSGLGASYLIDKFEKIKKINLWILVGSTLILASNIFRLYPNENVYFNFFVGGLKGAKKIDIHSWGNSFGAAYRQGVIWLNKNAQENSGIALARELMPNVPKLWLRPDLKLQNGYRSGYLKRGEYVMALTYQGTNNLSYFDKYLDRLLNPVFSVDVDGVSILKIWKNDVEHTKKEYINKSRIFDYNLNTQSDNISFEFKNLVSISRIEIEYSQRACISLASGVVQISKDGNEWERLPGTMPNEDWSVPIFKTQPNEGKLMIPFVGENVSKVKVIFSPIESCIKNIYSSKVFVFDDN